MITKKSLKNNFNNIENYLNSGHSLILFTDGEKLKVSSTRKNLLKVELNGTEFSLPKGYLYDKEELSIRERFNELVIEGVTTIDSLKLYDITLDKPLEFEKDYSILMLIIYLLALMMMLYCLMKL